MEPKTLRRSRRNRWLAGVCGGVGEYFGIDPNIVRLIAFFLPGFNVLAYLICAVLIPEG